MKGKFYGIGVGPGDPELLTLKAKRVLGEVDVLFIPKSRVGKRSLALSIVRGALDKGWELVDLLLPMTRDRDKLRKHWRQAARTVVKVLRQGNDSAFITLGDPTMYSTFTYLMKYVQEMEPETVVEIIPGVSAVNSVSAWIKEPLAEGGESLIVVPAINDREKLAKTIAQFDNIVLLKAGNQVGKVSEILAEQGVSGRVYYVSRCGFEDGFYTDNLQEITNRKLDYLSTIFIKKKPGGEGS